LDPIYQARARQWRRFAAWEAALHDPAPGLSSSLAWMAEAYDLARQSDPAWGSGHDPGHARHLVSVRAALVHVRLPA
jgi:hypothetical protein